MNSILKSEVLIIGAGPAGASLAFYLAGEGIGTTLIDKKKRIDTPLRCAEYVPRAIGRLFDRPISGINLSTVSMDTYIDYKYVNTISSPGFMLDRPVFIKSLVTDFKDNGGKFMSGTKAVSFHRDNDRGMVSTVIQGPGGERSTIKSRIVVGADGPNSIVGKYIGSTNSGYVIGLGENIPVVTKDKKKTLVFFSPEIEGGYGWIFPKEESTNLGVGCQFAGVRKNINLVLKKIYKDFKKKVFLMDIFDLSGSTARLSPPLEASLTAGLIPASGMNKKTVSGSFILAGDAAGLTNPITGAGIYNAVNSSKIISVVILDALKKNNMDVLVKIEKQYLDTFGRSLQKAVIRREELMNKWPESSDHSIGGSGSFNELIRLCWVSFKDYWKSG